jgi:hypothetical protein
MAVRKTGVWYVNIPNNRSVAIAAKFEVLTAAFLKFLPKGRLRHVD